ncbi:ribosomal RNA small subunit methyltransferase A [Candidatus Saccharibacteria bacterium]|nr:ribosomal RNA small subunit methyltransferase A [Candidatus Saccharibacteria bacterium]
MKNKKSLGQNWLTDRESLQTIADLASLEPTDTVLEIGPGLGYLTDKLLKTKARVVALEYDQDLIPKLQAKYAQAKSKPEIIEGDIREYDLSNLPAGYKICANIPYYLTANLLRKLTDDSHKPNRAVLLVQKEVAQKLAAQSKRSQLNVLVNYWFQTSLGKEVPASCFVPAPKVDSQVVVLDLRELPIMPIEQWDRFVRVTKLAFSSPRKKLRANLAAGLSISKEEADKLLHAADIDPNMRAEELDMDAWPKFVTAMEI